MLIRPHTPSDLPSLLSTFNHIIAQGDAFVFEHPFTPETLTHYLSAYPTIQIATHDTTREFLGAYLLRPNQPGRGAHVANATYLVSPQARRLGVGRALAEHSITHAKHLGYTALQFNAVVSTNLPAIALWHSLGFRTLATLPNTFRLPDHSLTNLLLLFREL
jgi:L-amino acid N-acyltransferase YncA